jgi:hypothetical protein
MVLLPQTAPIERIFGVAGGLRDEYNIFIAPKSMLQVGGTLH